MHPRNPDLVLPELRRQLEEILVMLRSDRERYAAIAEPDVGRLQSERASDSLLVEYDSDGKDDLYDDALVVVTEFGQASPAILQMWLSIDYSRATRILNRLQADGLVSNKGRVRHKAYSLRRSEQQPVSNTTT